MLRRAPPRLLDERLDLGPLANAALAGTLRLGTGRARRLPVNGKVIHRFISLGVFTFRVADVILIIEIEISLNHL